ncbi:MAG: hypothetical protein WD077_11840 [Bacteroidia bacterium]
MTEEKAKVESEKMAKDLMNKPAYNLDKAKITWLKPKNLIVLGSTWFLRSRYRFPGLPSFWTPLAFPGKTLAGPVAPCLANAGASSYPILSGSPI